MPLAKKEYVEPNLPDKISDLLDLALKDLRKCKKMKTRRLDMNRWFERRGKVCVVCMAGAVMDRTMKLEPGTTPSGCSYSNREKILFIDEMRRGHFFGTNNTVPPEIGHFIRNNFNERLQRAPLRIYDKAVKMLREKGL